MSLYLNKTATLLWMLTSFLSVISAQTTHTVCASGCDYTTISAAIAAATAGDNIVIQDAEHTENSIVINKDINICGGSPGTILQASKNPGTGNFRIFSVNNGVTATISDLVLRHGNLQNTNTGGAIFNAGQLALVNCTLISNRAHRGGAIHSTGPLGMVNCTLTGNAVKDSDVGLASGGAIYTSGYTTLANVTISGNTNTTTGLGDGGGMTVLGGGLLFLYHTTIANNTIGNTGLGAGVSAQTGAVLEFYNSIISNNTGATDLYNQGFLNPALNITNIVLSCTGSCPTFITDDPALLPLADNGGCTLTHDLGAASAAINAGTPIASITQDQRGATRSLTEPDIGAVELTASLPPCMASPLCDGVLPVEYLSLEAAQVGNKIKINWITAVEINNVGFEVERSNDGIAWKMLDFVPGQGSVSGNSHYQYVDQTPWQGVNYYRLKQIDLDGQFEYSPIRSVKMETGSNFNLRLYPNPASDRITIEQLAADRNLQLTIVNSLGQIVWESRAPELRKWELNLQEHGLSPGIYWLQARAGGQENQTFRIVVSKSGG